MCVLERERERERENTTTYRLVTYVYMRGRGAHIDSHTTYTSIVIYRHCNAVYHRKKNNSQRERERQKE